MKIIIQEIYLVKSIGIIVVSSLIYFLFVRSLRVCSNEKVFASIVNSILLMYPLTIK